MKRYDMAIWCTDNNNSIPEIINYEIDVHLNFWKLPAFNCLDIGIMFPKKFSDDDDFIKYIYIYINIKKIFIKDITKKLEKQETRHIIFNEFIPTTDCGVRFPSCKIAERNKEKFFINCKENIIEQTEDEYGTTLKIDTENDMLPNCCNLQYKRFRIYDDLYTEIFIDNIAPHSILQYYTTHLSYLDFRLNDVRSLPEEKSKMIRESPMLRHTRFLLMIGNKENIILDTYEPKRIRTIEKDKWEEYMNGDKRKPESKKEHLKRVVKSIYYRLLWGKNESGVILAYQWNNDDKRDFSLFVETKKDIVGIVKILIIMGVVILLGALGSCLANHIDCIPEATSQVIAEIAREK